MARLSREFYDRATLDVTRDLLGCYLVRRLSGTDGREVVLAGRITETEAYIGRCDKACHAYAYRRTARTETLFAPPGHAYVHCLNFVTEPEGEPAAVLLRAVEPVLGMEEMYRARYGDRPSTPVRWRNLVNGPGKVCRAFSITRAENGLDLTGDALFLCGSPADFGLSDAGGTSNGARRERVRCGPRIGVDYAEEARDFPWRFWLEAAD